jgi:hypothetical protein
MGWVGVGIIQCSLRDVFLFEKRLAKRVKETAQPMHRDVSEEDCRLSVTYADTPPDRLWSAVQEVVSSLPAGTSHAWSAA